MMSFSQEFLNAIENKDLTYLRAYITEGILLDPCFEKNDCQHCMDFLKEKGIDITEPFQLNANESPTPQNKAEWNKDLFFYKVTYLRRNFAYDKRIPEIKDIGKEVYGKESVSKPIIQNQSENRNMSPFAIAGIVAAIVAVIGLIIWILKK